MRLAPNRIIPVSDRETLYWPKFSLFMMSKQIPEGTFTPLYAVQAGDYQPNIDKNTIAVINSVTMICPGGDVNVHVQALAEPRRWEGSLALLSHGLFIRSNSKLEALVDSELRCVSPRITGEDFRDKLRAVKIDAGTIYKFSAQDRGFISLFGSYEKECYVVDMNEEVFFDQDTFIAVVEKKDV